MLDESFSRRRFEAAHDRQALCARLAEILTARLRAATDKHMELEWIVADLRSVGHDVQRWDQVIANWTSREDPYLWVWLEGVELDDGAEAPAEPGEPRVGVSFRPRLPEAIDFCCPLCGARMQESEVWLNIRGHGSATAPGVRVHFECPGLFSVDDTIGATSVERRRGARVCTSCGAALLLPPRR